MVSSLVGGQIPYSGPDETVTELELDELDELDEELADAELEFT